MLVAAHPRLSKSDLKPYPLSFLILGVILDDHPFQIKSFLKKACIFTYGTDLQNHSRGEPCPFFILFIRLSHRSKDPGGGVFTGADNKEAVHFLPLLFK